MRFEKSEKDTLYITAGYIILLLVYALVNRFSFTNRFLHEYVNGALYLIPGNPDMSDVLFLLGIPVMAVIIIKLRKSLLTYEGIFVIVYGLILVGTSVFVPDVDTFVSIKSSLRIIEIIFICYYVTRIFEEEDWKFLLKNAMLICTTIWGIGAAISFYYYLINYAGYWAFYGDIGKSWSQGMVVFRNYGAFADANLSSVICLLLIVGDFYLLQHFEMKKITRILLYIAIALFVLYLALAFSRTAYVTAGVTVFVASFFRVIKKDEENKLSVLGIIWRALLRSLIIAAILVASYFVITFACKCVGRIFVPDRDWNELVREEVFDNPDPSNGRFQIWKEYFDAFKERPVFGYSVDGAYEHIKNTNPNGLVSVVGYTNHHNTYFQLATQVGIVGFVAMIVFMFVPMFRMIYRLIVKRKKYPAYIYLLFVFAAIILSEGMFYDVGLVVIRFESVLLWLSLGGIKDTENVHTR